MLEQAVSSVCIASHVATDSESFTVQVQPVLGECEGCVSVAGASAYVDKGVYRNDFGASPIKKTGVYTLSVFSAGGACSTPRRCLKPVESSSAPGGWRLEQG